MSVLNKLAVGVACALLLISVAHGTSHTNNWAVIIDTSRYWLNYRHVANSLSVYRTVKRLGIPDSHIILMLADDMACNPRNPYPATVYNSEMHDINLYGSTVEVDYRNYEVTVESFIRVLTGRHDPAVPRSKRLMSDSNSNILIFITGHGGDEFIKFQSVEELLAQDLADAIEQMWEKGRYKEILLMVESCQADTVPQRITSPNVISMASSLKGENSYSYSMDSDIGLPTVDRFTYATLNFFEHVDINSRQHLDQLFAVYNYDMMMSHFSWRNFSFRRPLSKVRLTDFFGSVAKVHHIKETFDFQGVPPPSPESPTTHECLTKESQTNDSHRTPRPSHDSFEDGSIEHPLGDAIYATSAGITQDSLQTTSRCAHEHTCNAATPPSCTDFKVGIKRSAAQTLGTVAVTVVDVDEYGEFVGENLRMHAGFQPDWLAGFCVLALVVVIVVFSC